MELEARIKGYLLHSTNVNRLISHYDNWDSIVEYEEKRSRIIGTMGMVYRSINNGPIILKTKISSTKEEWYSLVLSSEEKPKEYINLVSKYFKTTRKKRWSRLENPNARLDITHFIEENIYQVEVEMPNVDQPDLEYVSYVISILQDSPRYVSRKRFELVREITEDLVIRHKYQKPVTLTYKYFKRLLKGEGDMYMTPKMDGFRMFIVVFNGMIYSVDTNAHVRLLVEGIKEYTSPRYIIVDTEYLDGIHYAFDIVDENIRDRLGEMGKVVREILRPHINIVEKKFVKVGGRPFMKISDFWEEIKGMEVDGIVFVDFSKGYYENVWKWKPMVTIDVFLEEPEPGVYEIEADTKKIIRRRYDKSKPNSEKVIQSNIREGLPLCHVWDGKTCFLMRKYHNKVKRVILESHDGVLLDIGTGQGGDIEKWRNMKKVFCIEPDSEPRKEFKKRLEIVQDRPHITLIKYPTREPERICRKIPKGCVDMISLFFCTNAFTRKEDWEGLREVIKHVASKRCTIVGIFMDQELIHEVNSHVVTIRWETKKEYSINIHGTRIVDQLEVGVKTKDFLSYCPGFRLEYTTVLDPKKRDMTKEEAKLSKMFRLVQLSNFV